MPADDPPVALRPESGAMRRYHRQAVALTPASWRVFRRRFFAACTAALVVIVTTVVVLNLKVADTLAGTKKIAGLRFPDGPAQGGNYLIIGSDSRAFVSDPGQEQAFGSKQTQTGQRADVMMVLHIDPVKKTSLLVSFPRDLIVKFPSGGDGQINSAFDKGPQEVIDIMRQDFNVQINHYVQLDFQAFISVVDAVGTIKVQFDTPTRDLFSGLSVPVAGCVALDGNSALAFVRSRHREEFINGGWRDRSGRSDLDRIQRQQDFIRKLAAKASAQAGRNPLDAIDIANAVVPKLQVDKQLSTNDILRLVRTFRNVDPNQPGALDMQTLPVVPSPSNPNRLVVKDAEAAPILDQLRNFGNTPTTGPVTAQPVDVTVSVVNGSNISGAAGRAFADLQAQAFAPGTTGNTATTPRTEVRYAAGALAKGQLVMQYLGGVGQLIEDSTLKGADVTVVIGADWSGVHARDKTVKPATVPTTAPANAGTTGSKPTATTKPPAGPVC